MRCWQGYLSKARCKQFAYGPAEATATPSFLVSLKSRRALLFWCRLTQVVLKKRSLNRSTVVCLSFSVIGVQCDIWLSAAEYNVVDAACVAVFVVAVMNSNRGIF